MQPKVPRRRKILFQFGCFLAACLVGYLGLAEHKPHQTRQTRRLAESLYPKDLLLDEPFNQATNKYMLVFHCLGVLYMFSGLAIVCDDYFVAALEIMVERWQLTPDVAGATLMAAGGSAPELFTSIMGVTVSESDVGFGTIVGSAVFNILFVIALCALFAKEVLVLTWWPLFRDCTYYCFSLTVLAIFVSTCTTDLGRKNGGEIELWEAIVLFLMYGLYVLIMKNNDRLQKIVTELSCFNKKAVIPDNSQDVIETKDSGPSLFTPRQTGLHLVRDIRGAAFRAIINGTVSEMVEKKLEGGSIKKNPLQKFQTTGLFVVHQARTLSHLSKSAQSKGDDSASENSAEVCLEEEDSILEWPSTNVERIVFIINLPLSILLHVTIPNCKRRRWENWYILTFLLSLAWIAVFSFLMVWWAETIGLALNIPSNVMGLTFLAAGTSIPDALSSVIVARQGYGDMAVSSSVGSNIFDILFGLPVPWILKTGFIMSSNHNVVIIQSPYLLVNVFTLLVMVAFVVISIIWCKWKLNPKLGMIMFILYFLFLGSSLGLEYCSSLGLC